jgi:hypothetical protein
MLHTVVSGGQTGVDRAALDAAAAAGLARGGFCPRARAAEDGPIPAAYPLRETPSADPAERTSWNVRDSDATLALTRGAPRGGTALALERARELGRPALRLDLAALAPADAARSARAWLRRERVGVLNVAGPRESEAPGIYAEARALLEEVLRPSPEGNR